MCWMLLQLRGRLIESLEVRPPASQVPPKNSQMAARPPSGTEVIDSLPDQPRSESTLNLRIKSPESPFQSVPACSYVTWLTKGQWMSYDSKRTHDYSFRLRCRVALEQRRSPTRARVLPGAVGPFPKESLSSSV